MFTAAQIVAHLIGDYILQSDYMAMEKTKRWLPAAIHGLVYTLPFLLFLNFGFFLDLIAFGLIAGTHAVIDHYRLARYVCWMKNNMAPPFYNLPWEECQTTGYPNSKPAWMAVWLLIITDNILHIVINALILWACSQMA